MKIYNNNNNYNNKFPYTQALVISDEESMDDELMGRAAERIEWSGSSSGLCK